jgi:sec-independent protein translocase protein TatA
MFEGIFQPMHLLVILVICVLVFGPKKLGDLGRGLGEGVRDFKKALRGDPAATADASKATPLPQDQKHS